MTKEKFHDYFINLLGNSNTFNSIEYTSMPIFNKASVVINALCNILHNLINVLEENGVLTEENLNKIMISNDDINSSLYYGAYNKEKISIPFKMEHVMHNLNKIEIENDPQLAILFTKLDSEISKEITTDLL